MRYLAITVLGATLLFSACGIKKPFAIKNSGKTSTNPTLPHLASKKTANTNNASIYIERYKAIAITEMNQYGIPSSITLAQGLLESGNGNSMLATQANNHFGIKCTSSWKGKTILKDDDQSNECFRAYKTPEESFRDHSEFLKRPRYAFLFELDKNDYAGWAKGLKKAGYATNPSYPELLIGLIERYNLQQYDRSDNPVEKAKRESSILSEIATQKHIDQKKDELIKSPVIMKIYEVKQGDTLYSISRHFALTVDDLKSINNLMDDTIKLGQLLLVSK